MYSRNLYLIFVGLFSLLAACHEDLPYKKEFDICVAEESKMRMVDRPHVDENGKPGLEKYDEIQIKKSCQERQLSCSKNVNSPMCKEFLGTYGDEFGVDEEEEVGGGEEE